MAPIASGKKKGHSKTVVGANEEIKKGEFAAPSLPMRLTKTALSVLDKDDKRSDCGSIASSNKSASGAIKRHCEPCSFKLFSNWPQHKTKAHGGIEVASVKCIGDWQCPKCNGKYFETFHFYIHNGISISKPITWVAFLYPNL